MTDEIVRSDEEIIRYYGIIERFDFFGVWGTELLLRLPLQKAIPFMKGDHGWDEESWSRTKRKRDKTSLIDEMEDYIQDAIDKAVSHKKSCVVSLDYYRAWAWLLKDMDLFSYLIDGRNFPNFGAPMLYAVIEKYSLQDLLPDDEIKRTQFLNMALGKKCNNLCPSCGEGRPSMVQKSLILPNAYEPK
jgi:hypothetical protein